MKAAVCHAFGQPLAVEDVELDVPLDDEVAVRLAATAICHSDVAFAEGAWGGPLPAVYGHEAAGVVEAVGAGVDGLASGDRVVVTLVRSCRRCHACSRGQPALCEGTFARDGRPALRSAAGEPVAQGLKTAAFAERVVVHASQAVRIPDDVPLEQASLLACGVVTGFGAVVNTAGVEAGSSVVVVGVGGVGLNSVQGAAHVGADPIVAVDRDAAKLELACRLGATHAVDASREDVRAAVLHLTDGGADHVFVAVGAPAVIQDGLALLRRGGSLVILGMPPDGTAVTFDPGELAHNGLRILGSKVGSTRPDLDIPRLVELYRAGTLHLDELVSGRFPLARINDAIADAKAGRALRNLIVFE